VGPCRRRDNEPVTDCCRCRSTGPAAAMEAAAEAAERRKPKTSWAIMGAAKAA